MRKKPHCETTSDHGRVEKGSKAVSTARSSNNTAELSFNLKMVTKEKPMCISIFSDSYESSLMQLYAETIRE